MARITRATRATKAPRKRKAAGNGHYSQRAAGVLHDGVERMAERGERLERRLHDGAARIDDEAHRLFYNVRGRVGDHPWMAVGSSAALGFLVGLISSRGIEHHRDSHYGYHRGRR